MLIIQINVRCQHGARATVRRLAARTIDNIPEQLQLGGGGNLIGGDCGAKAVHVNGFIADSVGHRNAAIHRAAGHGKFAAVFNKHTVAAIHRRAAFDIAAGHFKAAAAYMYAAAGHIGKVQFHFLNCAAVLDFCTAGQGDFSTARRDKYTAAVQCRAVRNATAAFHGENRRIVFRDISANIYTATGDAVAAGDGRVSGHGKSGVIKIDAAAKLCCAVLNHGISRQGDQRVEVRTDTAAATRTALCAYAIRNESAATHGKGGTIAEANAAAGLCNAAPDAAAGHGEIGMKARVHSAAGRSRAANDVAARHDKVGAVGFVRLLRRVLFVITFHPNAHFFAASDDTAVDGFSSVFLVQHPQAVSVRRELMYSIGVTVGQRQLADANTAGVFLHFNHRVTIVAGHLQDMTVQVQRHGAGDGQETADANVPCQLDGVDTRISNRRSQLIRGADLFYRFARGGCPALTAQRRQGRLRLGVGHFSLRLGCRIVCGLGVLCTVIRQSALRAADGAIRIHAFRRAGRFTAAHGRGFRAFLRKSRCWHKAQQHTQGKQGAYDSLFHLVSFALCCPLAAPQ